MDVDDEAGAVGVAADLRRAVVRLGRRLRMERQQGALSANKLSVLAHLYERGPSTPGQVAAAEHQHPQSLTRVFAELQLGGLVSRVASEDDLRASVLTLTPGGRRALRKDMAEQRRLVGRCPGHAEPCGGRDVGHRGETDRPPG